MHLNDDFGRRVVLDAASLPWLDSPGGHVARRMLDRTGGERARATSLVRYAPGSRFPAHTHGGGEEFLVLDGVFSDEHGDVPAGWYARNPVGSRHVPRSDPGCVIFVKLWWMRPADQAIVRLDTVSTRPEASADGIATLALHAFGAETTAIVHLAPGARLAERATPGGEEMLVLSGACHDADGGYPPMTWSRRPPGRAPELCSATGARLFVKRGHLADPPPAPA